MSTSTGDSARHDSGLGWPRAARWRVVDIVVAAVIAIAFGVVFWAWGQFWTVTGPAFTAFPPAQAFMYGVWLVPAVLAPLVIRRPGAAIFTELVAALVSVLLGSPWGGFVIVYGLVEGAAGELAFAATRYRRWNLPVALLAGGLTGIAASGLDLGYYYRTWALTWQVTYTALVVASCVAIAGLGSYLLVRALARTGVLDPFPSGRAARPV